MGQVYIAVVAIMFLIINKYVSREMRLDKHIRTGILRGRCWAQRKLVEDCAMRCKWTTRGKHVV